MVVVVIGMVVFTVGLSFGFLPAVSVAFFGITLTVIGSLFLVDGSRTKPKLLVEARRLLKELSIH
jgi:hypothetical protein